MIQENDIDRVVEVVKKYQRDRHEIPDDQIAIEPDAVMSHLGLDSMDMICISAVIEDEFGCKIDPTTFLKATTIRLAMKAIIEEQQSRIG